MSPKSSSSRISQAQKSPFENPARISKSRPKAKKHHLKLLNPVENSIIALSETTSPFLRLPGEIRNLVYSYALTSPTSSLIYDAPKMRFPLDEIGHGLLTSCHAIGFETQYLHLKLNTLVFAFDDGASMSTRNFAVILTNLERLGDTKMWGIQVEMRARARNGSWTMQLGQSRKFA